jgi:hypothetical protein
LEASRDTPSADWFEGPLGARVLREEAALAPLALDDVFGFELLQVGAWGPGTALARWGAHSAHHLGGAGDESGGHPVRPLDSLPFRSDSIDAIFLPHTLELMEDPYAVLREAERVLCCGRLPDDLRLQPIQRLGRAPSVRALFGRPVFPPQTRRLLSERRLRDWVAVLGFDVDSVYGYLGMLPTKGRTPMSGRAPHGRPAPTCSRRASAFQR